MKEALSHLQSHLCKCVDWVKRVRKAMELAPYIDDLYEAFEERGTDGKLTPHERALLENLLAFGEITADDISVPRAEIIALPETADLKKVLQAFKTHSHNRLPVFGKDMDDIKGFITMKDVIVLLDKPEKFDIKEILHPIMFVQESMTLPRILQMMKKTHMPLVLVTDEFGGTSGLISRRDVVEELVGDLEGEHGSQNNPALVPMGGGRYRVRGDCLLEEFDRTAGTHLYARFGQEVETVGGAVMQVARTIPAKGERVRLADGVESTVVASDGRHLYAVDLKVTQP